MIFLKSFKDSSDFFAATDILFILNTKILRQDGILYISFLIGTFSEKLVPFLKLSLANLINTLFMKIRGSDLGFSAGLSEGLSAFDQSNIFLFTFVLSKRKGLLSCPIDS